MIAYDFVNLFIGLQVPLYQTSLFYRTVFTSIALQFNLIAKESVSLIKQVFPQYSFYLNLIAKDRGIIRLVGESLFSYRNRVICAYEFQKFSSTKSGIENLISQITEKSFIIRELYKESWILGNPDEFLGISTIIGSPEYRFYFIVEFTEVMTIEEKAYLEEILKIYSPAHVGFRIIGVVS